MDSVFAYLTQEEKMYIVNRNNQNKVIQIFTTLLSVFNKITRQWTDFKRWEATAASYSQQ